MELSARLQAIADLVRYPTMADIGTDHGYVPIALHKRNSITKAFACDIHKGPLEKAKKNILSEDAQEVIETRLGNGLCPLQPYEAESIVIAGMGGILIREILLQSPQVAEAAKELIISPHSDTDLVRRTLHKMGFFIEEEQMLKEDGKYYTILRAIHGQENYDREIEYLYGKKLLEKKDGILLEFLSEQKKKAKRIYKALCLVDTESAKMRRDELLEEIDTMEEGIQCLLRAETL